MGTLNQDPALGLTGRGMVIQYFPLGGYWSAPLIGHINWEALK